MFPTIYPDGELVEVGIPTHAMNLVVALQQATNWCWAACIVMVYRLHGIHVTQEEVVGRTFGVDAFGRAPNFPAPSSLISQNLSGTGYDAAIDCEYVVECRHGYGAPSADLLLNELENGNPVIVNYNTGRQMRHAVVLTGVKFSESIYGREVVSFVIRDPSPNRDNVFNLGRKEYNAAEFWNAVEEHWIVRAENCVGFESGIIPAR